jgi:hypothetical protein
MGENVASDGAGQKARKVSPISVSRFAGLIAPPVVMPLTPPKTPEAVYAFGTTFPVGEQQVPEQLLLTACNVPPQFRKKDTKAFLRMEESFIRFLLKSTEIGYEIPSHYLLRSSLHPRIRSFFDIDRTAICETDAQVISRNVVRIVELKQRRTGAPFMIGEEQLVRYSGVSLKAANLKMKHDISAGNAPHFIAEYGLLSYAPTELASNGRSGAPDLLIILPVAAVASLLLFDPICKESRRSWDFSRGGARLNRDLKSNVLRQYALAPQRYEGDGASEEGGEVAGKAGRFLRGLSREVTQEPFEGKPVTIVRFYLNPSNHHAFPDMRAILEVAQDSRSFLPPHKAEEPEQTEKSLGYGEGGGRFRWW